MASTLLAQAVPGNDRRQIYHRLLADSPKECKGAVRLSSAGHESVERRLGHTTFALFGKGFHWARHGVHKQSLINFVLLASAKLSFLTYPT